MLQLSRMQKTCYLIMGPKYEELVAESLSSKNRSKEFFGSIKIKDYPKREMEGSPFVKGPNLESEEIGGENVHSCWSNLTTTITYRRIRKG